ncbi:hypothetical protein [Haloarcula sp. JP-L23]|uniref:hypothetical protein n=1 Tax=Haloarcula sp. JP-L23 TaxID=2716717 RepID=UPI00140ECDF2|nr:hypothetical protein G9465_15735 [Haloarcula sp. JP-L23]
MSEDLNGMEQWVQEQDNMVIEDDGSITNTETGVNTSDDDSGNAPIYDSDTTSYDEAVSDSSSSSDPWSDPSSDPGDASEPTYTGGMPSDTYGNTDPDANNTDGPNTIDGDGDGAVNVPDDTDDGDRHEGLFGGGTQTDSDGENVDQGFGNDTDNDGVQDQNDPNPDRSNGGDSSDSGGVNQSDPSTGESQTGGTPEAVENVEESMTELRNDVRESFEALRQQVQQQGGQTDASPALALGLLAVVGGGLYLSQGGQADA